MILSNSEIISALKAGKFSIDPIAGMDPQKAPFNTSAVDLRLADEILVPDIAPAAYDLRTSGIAAFLARNSKRHEVTEAQPFTLKPHHFILGRTMERVSFPCQMKGTSCFSARVEGKSSLARCGVIVHFTAPTVHAGFEGTITLEMINLGPINFLLYPEMFICQLIIEQVKGIPTQAPSQFKGQDHPAGIKTAKKS